MERRESRSLPSFVLVEHEGVVAALVEELVERLFHFEGGARLARLRRIRLVDEEPVEALGRVLLENLDFALVLERERLFDADVKRKDDGLGQALDLHALTGR